MSKDTISVNMNVYDIPIVVELLKKLEQENKQLNDTLREILHFCNHLHNDCKYRLNDGHIRKIRNICKQALNEEKEVK